MPSPYGNPAMEPDDLKLAWQTLSRRLARHEALHDPIGDDDEFMAASDDEPREARRDLATLLGQLPDRHRLPILYVKIEGRSVAETAKATGMSESAVKVGIHRGLKALAKELDIPIIALAQLNRGLESRPNKRPTMGDLRDSGEIEQDADIIMFLYRDEVYNPDSQAKGICEVLIEKQRQGETGMVPLSYQGEFTLFGDLARGYTPPEPKALPRKAIRDDL